MKNDIWLEFEKEQLTKPHAITLSVSSPIFLTWIPVKHLGGSFLRISAASYFQDKGPS